MSLLLHFTTTVKLKLILQNGLRFVNVSNRNDIFEKSDLIDEMGYELYGLSEDEIKVMD